MMRSALTSLSLQKATRPLARPVVRGMALFPERQLKNDEPTKTSLSEIADRTAEAFFMTEIFRALGLCFEVAMKPKVTINYPYEKGPISPR